MNRVRAMTNSGSHQSLTQAAQFDHGAQVSSEPAPEASGPRAPVPLPVRRELHLGDAMSPPHRTASTSAHDLVLRRAHPDRAPAVPGTPTRVGPAPIIRRTLTNIQFAQRPEDQSWFITTVVADRSAGTGGGAHATAYGVFVDSAIYAVRGKSFRQAVKNLLVLCNDVAKLPEFLQAKEESPAAKKVKATEAALLKINSDPDYTKLSTKHDMVKTQIVERLFREYLDLRNGAPGVVIANSSGAKVMGAKNEKKGINLMSEAQEEWRECKVDKKKKPAPKLATTFGEGAWLAFDHSGLTPRKDSATAWAKENKTAISNHLASCLGYPESGNYYPEWSRAFVGLLGAEFGYGKTKSNHIQDVVAVF
jgi:hypothetical protein